MRLDLSVPKKRPGREAFGAGGEGGPRLCSAREGAEAFLADRAAKALIVAEDASFSLLLKAVRAERSVTLLWEDDALPLFAMPDTVGCVLAAGRAPLLRAARFFARVRAIPCALFPTDAAQDGTCERRGCVRVGGHDVCVPLAEAQIFCDVPRMRESLAEAYARLLLSRLALFEAEGACMIARREWGGVAYEGAFSLLDPVCGALDDVQIVVKNAAMRMLEREGAPVGEGMALAARLSGEPSPAFAAYAMLGALYRSFFERGRPRRYAVPDYRARALAAGVSPSACDIPSREQYAARALMLERVRGRLLTQLRALDARRHRCAGAMRARGVAVRPAARGAAEQLKRLPEFAPGGLSALIRDFGLMEWEL